MACDEADKVPNQYLAQLQSARSAVESARSEAVESPTPSSIASISSTWKSSTADAFRSELNGKNGEITGKFDALLGNLDAEISRESAEPKVCPDDPRADRNVAGPRPF